MFTKVKEIISMYKEREQLHNIMTTCKTNYMTFQNQTTYHFQQRKNPDLVWAKFY